MGRCRPKGRFILLTKYAMSRFIDYLKDTQVELRHIAWPTRKQAIVYTALVIGISVMIGLIVGLFDFLFARGINWFIK